MPRLPYIAAEAIADGPKKKTVGHASNLHRILGYNPRLLASWKILTASLRDDCVTPRSLRELITLRVAQLGTSDYMFVEHVPMALAAGVSHEQIAELSAWRTSDSFYPGERVVLRIAEAVHQGNVSEDDFTSLSEHYSDEEVMEIILTAAFYGMVPNFTQALDIQPEAAS
jgi:AhpD family alkylhydroperoxidase